MEMRPGSSPTVESLPQGEASPNRAGRVVAVCSSPRGGIPKHPQERVTVGPYGVEGDYHARPTKLNRHTGVEEPNRRQVSVTAREVQDGIGLELGVTIPAGGFGENVQVEGLGDLSDLAPGDRLRFSSGVVFEVTGQVGPCKNLSVYHPRVPRLSYGRRGIVAVVLQPGPLQAGDTVEVLPASPSPLSASSEASLPGGQPKAAGD